jgi:hypothetical protein
MTYTTAELAERCGVTPETILRWGQQWQPATVRFGYSDTDARVARAWSVIDGYDESYGPPPNGQLLRTLAETVIRYRPRRWLALSAVGASTHDTAADAVKAWQDHGHVFVRLIDLEARTGPRQPLAEDAAQRAVGRSPHEPFTGAAS